MKTTIFTVALMLGLSIQLVSCGGEEKKEEAPAQDTTAKAEPAEPAYEYKYQVEEVEVAPRWAVTYGDSTMLTDLSSEFYGKKFGGLSKFVASKKMAVEPPFARFDEFSEEKKFYTVTGLYVNDSTLKVKEPMKLQKTYGGKALKVVYLGNYDENMKVAYNDMMQYMKEKNMQPAGSPWEHYVTDPTTVKDTAQWKTDIYFPVAPATAE